MATRTKIRCGPEGQYASIKPEIDEAIAASSTRRFIGSRGPLLRGGVCRFCGPAFAVGVCPDERPPTWR